VNHKEPRLSGYISFNTELGEFLNETRIRLLEAIALHGSLTHAARSLPLSYKAAWDALETMNRLSGQPIVVRAAGGVNGGGTSLTEYGRCLIALYRAVENECRLATGELLRYMANGGDAVGFRYQLHRHVMARQQNVAEVTERSIS
jgi:molybdate transport system regulatory protein